MPRLGQPESGTGRILRPRGIPGSGSITGRQRYAAVSGFGQFSGRQIANELYQEGLIPHKFEESPFETRLADLFSKLTAEDFLKYGRSWRDRLSGYFHLMSN